MSLWDDVEENDKNEELNLSNFNHTMSENEQDSIFSVISKEVSLCSDDRKNQLFELFIKKSNILKSKSDNKYLKNPILGMDFISQIFSPSEKNKEVEIAFEEFNDFIIKDFTHLANSIAIQNQVELNNKLLKLKDELYEDIKFIELLGKTLVGVGGSFSAGKSSFLNAIFNSEDNILPVETRPTTSIPTFVIQNDEEKIYTFNNDGSKSKINKDGLSAISHEFKEVYNLGLASLIKNMVVYTPAMPYANIAFLDTPGYSKSDGINQTDRKIAKEYLQDLDALIWLLDSDNGTIRQSDIDFLNELDLKDDIYVLFVVNKADKKPENELQKILEVTKENLNRSFNHDFSITAYSSHDKIEYFNENKISNFLKLLNQVSTNRDYFNNCLEIFEFYEQHLDDVRTHNKKLLEVFNQIDIYGDSILSGIDDFGYLESSIKSELQKNKAERKIFDDTKEKCIIQLEKVLKLLNIDCVHKFDDIDKNEAIVYILSICSSIDGDIVDSELQLIKEFIEELQLTLDIEHIFNNIKYLTKEEKIKLFVKTTKVFKKFAEEKEEETLLKMLATLIGADGKVDEDEEILLIILAKTLQVDLEIYFESMNNMNTFSIKSIVTNQDKKYIVSASSDKTIKIWDVQTNECLSTFEGHTNFVRAVVLSSDEKYIVSGSNDQTIKIWDTKTGECLNSLEGHFDYVNSIAISTNGKYIVSGSGDKTIKIWDLKTGKCLKTLKGHTSYVVSVAISTNGKYIVSGSGDKTIKIWDLKTGKYLKTLKGHSNFVNSVVVSPDGENIISGSNDNTIKIWDTKTGKCLKTLKGHTSSLSSIAISPDGENIISGSFDKTIKIWNIKTGECLKTLKGHSNWINSLAIGME